MTKVIIKTVKAALFIDPTNGQVIHPEVPQVVEQTGFIGQQIAEGAFKLYSSNIPKHATNEELQEFVADSKNHEQAVAAFLSKFGLDEVGNVTDEEVAKKAQEEADAKAAADAEQAKKDANAKELQDAQEAAKLKAAQEAAEAEKKAAQEAAKKDSNKK